ncbi:hypothetical protein C8Q80DRAFT_1124968 [Daedaleopsis nitida]|nr:hypothetical protein C8Q80DRAFT_1124968 [Daedaleopsis nitida]
MVQHNAPPESSQLNESISITQPTVRETLGNKFKVPPGSKENTFLLNASTAGARKTGLSADADHKYRSSQAPLDDHEGLIHALVVLEQFVSSKALAHLLTKSVAKEIHDKKEAIQTEAGISDKSVDDNNNEDADDAASITSEDKGDVTFYYLNAHSIPVIRYVSSLAIPLSASRSICRHLFKSLTVVAEVSVSMVTIAGTPKIHVDQNWISSTWQRLKDTLHLDDAQVKKLRTLLDDKTKRLPLVPVHAEAALMAAAVQVAEGKLDECSGALQATSANEQKIRIGVSKKCCFCCAVLGEELNKLPVGGDGPVRYPQFVLPGQHGIIFPWYPPPGLSVEVLRNMAKRLEQALETYLVAKLGTGRAQTSPTTSDHSQPDDIYDPKSLRKYK